MLTPLKIDKIKELMIEASVFEEDIEESFILGGGPGGQKTNKTSNVVRIKHSPSGLNIKYGESRSREDNRWLARRALAEAIVERAIIDWDTLGRGRLKSIKSDGQVIHLNKVLGFFFSDWFGELLGTFSQRTPEWVRQQIGIPDYKTAAEVFHAIYR
jgi:hypothetical protein